METSKKKISVTVRPPHREDLADMVAIENEVNLHLDEDFEVLAVRDSAWTKQDFEYVLSESKRIGQRETRGYVATDDDKKGRVIGFVIISLLDGAVEVLNLAVDKKYQRHGVGIELMTKAHERAERRAKKFGGVCSLLVRVPLWNVDANKFFAALGMKCRFERNGISKDEDAVLHEMEVKGVVSDDEDLACVG